MKLIMESWRKFMLKESQFADTAAEEAEKINSQAGIQLNTSQEYWEQMGVSTGEQLAIALLTQTYSDMHKSLHGRRPYGQFYSVEAVQSAIEDLDKQAEAMIEQDKLDAQAEAEYQEKKAELQALMPDEYDTEYEKMPQQMGMGRAAGMREDKELHEVVVYRGVYVTSREPFLKAIRDMVEEVKSNGGDVQTALTTIEQSVDQGKYSNRELRYLIGAGGHGVARGLYVTTREKFLEAMSDAGELAKVAHESAYSIASQIERRVDQGKYSDPRVRSMMREEA